MPYLLFFKKRQNLQSSSAANYRWCLLGSLSQFFSSSADIFQHYFFFKLFFLDKNNILVLNSLDPDKARQNVGPDLGPNCLHTLSADDKFCR